MEQRLGTTNELIEALERNGTTGTIALTDEAGEMRAVIITPKTWAAIQQAFAKRRVPKQRAAIPKRRGKVAMTDFLGHEAMMDSAEADRYKQRIQRSGRMTFAGSGRPRWQGKQSYRSRHARKRLTRARTSG